MFMFSSPRGYPWSTREVIRTICDSVNHTRFPKEDHLPDVKKPSHVDHETKAAIKPHSIMYVQYHKGDE